MRIKLGILLALCLCLMAGMALAGETEARYGIIQGGSLHMRKEPSQGAAIEATYDGGTWVQIVAETDEVWDEVIAEDGKHGYMMVGYILPDMLEAGDWGTVDNGDRYVNLRSGPSKEDGVIGHVASGDRFELLAYGADYSMVRFDGTAVGYIASSLIKLDGEAEFKQETTHTLSGQNLNLHSAPSQDGEIIASYPNGTKVLVLIEGKTWSKVFVNGSFGYMHTPSLQAHKTKKAATHTQPAPVVQQQPPSVVKNPTLAMGPGPVNPVLSGGDAPLPFANHPRGGPQVVSYDFTPDESFHDSVGEDVGEDKLDG